MRLRPFAVLIFLLLVPRLSSPQGEPLGTEFRVNTDTSSSQRAPSVASAGEDFVVVWDSQSGDGSYNFGIRGQRYDSAGNPLGTEFRVNTYTFGPQAHPGVGANASGAFVVVWENGPTGCGPPCPPPTGMKVMGQRYAASGSPLGPEFVVSTGNSYERFPRVAVAPSGAFLAVWNTQGGGGPGPPGPFHVLARPYDSSGAPLGPPFAVNTYTPLTETARGAVAVDPAGNFVVVWDGEYQYGLDWAVFGQRYAASGTPLGPQFRVNTYNPGFQFGPGVATDPSGNFVVAWSSESSGTPPEPGLFGQRFAASGAPLGPEFRINTYTPGAHNGAVIAVDGGGNFVIVWVDKPATDGGDVFGQRYSSLGDPTGPEFRVNTSSAFVQNYPWVASTPNGIFLVTWQSGTGSFTDVFGQRFGGVFPVKLQDFEVH